MCAGLSQFGIRSNGGSCKIWGISWPAKQVSACQKDCAPDTHISIFKKQRKHYHFSYLPKWNTGIFPSFRVKKRHHLEFKGEMYTDAFGGLILKE